MLRELMQAAIVLAMIVALVVYYCKTIDRYK